MAEFRLKKGYDIPIAGHAQRTLKELPEPGRVAVLPYEFPGIKLRLLVHEGDRVKQGTPLLQNKEDERIVIVSPLSGKILRINRGERRKLLEVVIENDGKHEKETIPVDTDLTNPDRQALVQKILSAGLWPYIIQRPFTKIANPDDVPRDIFISGMATAPLAADPNFLLEGQQENFQLGVDILSKLTDGKIYLSLDGRKNVHQSETFLQVNGVEPHFFSGPHPAGNVGIQIHHIKPLNIGEKVWQIQPYAVAMIGQFFKQGYFPNQRIVSVAGTGLYERNYFKTILGSPISTLIPEKNIARDEVRIINGDVLTGTKTSLSGYVSFYEHLISVIPEGKKERKLLGYFRPGLKMISFSHTFLSTWLGTRNKEFELDTRINGAKRAFVMSASDYERFLPMDILPIPLAKSILAEDIEEMEGLGILELAEEDIALCSYACLSKTDFGQILRNGLDLIEREENL